jgi:hypothetical protein
MRNIKLNTTIVILIVLTFVINFLPRQLLGKWNAISNLESGNISEIHIKPSKPNWEVNLTGKDFIISDKKQIETIINLLRSTEIYFPAHPSRIWETKLVFTSQQKEIFEIEIHQTENNGTVIYTPTNEWRKDSIGEYLAKLVSYIKPVYSDTSTTKF